MVTKKEEEREGDKGKERDTNVGEIDKEREIPTLPVANDKTLSIFNILGQITTYPPVV